MRADGGLERGSCSHGRLQTRSDAPGMEATPLPTELHVGTRLGAVEQPGRCHKECMVSALARRLDVCGRAQPRLPLWPHCPPNLHLPRCPWVDKVVGALPKPSALPSLASAPGLFQSVVEQTPPSSLLLRK